MKTITAKKALTQIQTHAEKIKNDDAHVIETCSPGDMWAQGDVGILCIESVPAGATLIEKPSRQLAPGTTQGSRHCIADMATVRLYRVADANPLDGPVIDAPHGVTVEHPEHGDISLPSGVYAVIYQRAYADELRRVQD